MKRLVFLLLLLAGPAFAVLPSERLADPALEARARALSLELRCQVCQNQSIDDSNAPLAADLRRLVRERLVAGDSDAGVLDYVVRRYGDYVLLRPPMREDTALLWFGPLAILVLGGRGRLRLSAPAQARRRSSPHGRGRSAVEGDRGAPRMIWALAILLAGLSIGAVLWPLLRPKADAQSRAEFDKEIYRDQLAEIDRDMARGAIGEAEAKAARAEIGRRLLAVANETAEASVARPALRKFAVLLVLALPVGGCRFFTPIAAHPACPASPWPSGGCKAPTKARAIASRSCDSRKRCASARPRIPTIWKPGCVWRKRPAPSAKPPMH